MKSKRLLLLFIMCFTQPGIAQRTLDVFNPYTPIAWLGLDFTLARFIGDHSRFTSIPRTQFLLEDLNDLMVNEKDKYDVGKMLGKGEVEMKINVTKDHNAALDIDAVLADSLGAHHHLHQEEIQAIVESYEFKNNAGMGVMFIIESFNKKQDEALIWITFINMDTKEVLMTEKLGQSPVGFGLRNYWAGAIYGIMVRVRKSEYKKWQAKYLRNQGSQQK